jgi:hypothetical protein
LEKSSTSTVLYIKNETALLSMTYKGGKIFATGKSSTQNPFPAARGPSRDKNGLPVVASRPLESGKLHF